MVVRRERPGDVAGVDAVVRAAFETALEAELLGRLRADAGWLPALSLVAVRADAIVGHVVCTRGHVDAVQALGLGPIAVAPDAQGTGVGSALMHAVLGAAEALGEPLVCLLGDPAFYARFGFVTADGLGVAAPDPEWGAFFQARALRDDPPRGGFRYAAPFDDL